MEKPKGQEGHHSVSDECPKMPRPEAQHGGYAGKGKALRGIPSRRAGVLTVARQAGRDQSQNREGTRAKCAAEPAGARR
jgi:hypothetical protein